MRKLIPIILGLLGVAGGIGAGLMLPSDPHEPAPECAGTLPETPGTGKLAETAEETSSLKEYVKLNNQFVVPVIERDQVSALVLLSLTVEVGSGQKENVFAIEPRLRDSLLRVLFDHANMGGFKGAFTASDRMETLRRALVEEAAKASGHMITDVLILDIVRQDA